MDSITILYCRQPSKPAMITSDPSKISIESDATLPANLISVLHQESDKEKREAYQEHYRENDPAAGANPLERVRAMG